MKVGKFFSVKVSAYQCLKLQVLIAKSKASVNNTYLVN